MSRGARAALGLAVVVLAGCGYSLKGNLPDRIKTVAVPVFANHTQEPAIENFLTRAVIEAFATNGRLRVVTPEEADAILEGDVIGYQIESVAFDSRANVRQYRLTVTMNLKLRDVRRNIVLFEEKGFREKADFQVLGAVSQTISREETAQRLAATDIARSIVSLALDRF